MNEHGTTEIPLCSDIIFYIGQGKLLPVQELAANTLKEIQKNILSFRATAEKNGNFSSLLEFARLLRSIRTV